MRSLSGFHVATALLLLVSLGVASCLSPPVESPKTTVTQQTDIRVEQNIKNRVDILFVVDNSPSMDPKQTELKMRFPQLIAKLNDFAARGNPAWYHIGVITSDLGAGRFSLGTGSPPQCHPGGDGGRLQAIGAGASTTMCGRLKNGLNFIDYNQINNTNNLPDGQDLPTTFSCMASVGSAGCGFEHQLESVYRALRGIPEQSVPPPVENQGFLRDDALLAVVWVTDEDDCSADTQGDLFDPNMTAQYGILHSFRCNHFGLFCDGALEPDMPAGPFQSCRPATTAEGGKLLEVSRYIDLFTKPAPIGIKTQPSDVILASIAAPPSPVTSAIATPCDNTTASCNEVVHSCVASSNSNFFGDPAVRLSTVVSSVQHQQQTSICDTDYTNAIASLGDLIVSQISKACLDSFIVDRKAPDGSSLGPDCIVEDVTSNPDGTTTIKSIDSCATNGGVPTCWKVEQKPDCPPVTGPNGEQQNIGITIDRGQNALPPPNTQARVSCATIAH